MRPPSRFVLPGIFVSLLSVAQAQTGTLDQNSPTQPTVGQSSILNCDATTLTWQAQVRAGRSGRLEGFLVRLNGPAGATVRAALRSGPGWNTGPVVFQTILAKTMSVDEDVFTDVTSANIQVAPGTLFVIELQGQGTGCWVTGDYIDPNVGPAQYPEPLFLNGPGCFTDCGWRIGFMTWVQTTAGATYCSGDGTGTACPCGNAGLSGNGCASSANANGAHVDVSGTASIAADSLVITGSGMPNSSALYFQGTSRINSGAGTVFGDGLRCAGGTILRLGSKTNTSGASSYPTGNDQPISIRGSNSAGAVRDYQCWYRNAAAFCTPSTFNLTNGVEVTWAP